MMTKLLELAISKICELPAADQDLIARALLAELKSEQKWEQLFAQSPEKLAKLADMAWAKYQSGTHGPTSQQ